MSLHIDAEVLTHSREPRRTGEIATLSDASTSRRPRKMPPGPESGRRLPRALNGLSRIWLDRHGGEGASSVISAVLERPVALDLIFPGWDEPSERRLSGRESELLRQNLELLAHLLSSKERYVLWRTSGAVGEPQSLTSLSRLLGITRERVRQIERSALSKLGVSLPRGKFRSPAGRRRRARLLLQGLILG
jgi:DNA-binding CsgD family transcriptional regulator